jgi:hypothetical protein
VRFHANHVSASADGDYYQVLFEAAEDAADSGSPYLVVQRQFEDGDIDLCYVETHDEDYVGHFRLRRMDLSATGLFLEIARPVANIVEVTFSLPPSEFAHVARVAGIISGAIEAP